METEKYLPTEEEIAAEVAAIQAGWTIEERLQRGMLKLDRSTPAQRKRHAELSGVGSTKRNRKVFR